MMSRSGSSGSGPMDIHGLSRKSAATSPRSRPDSSGAEVVSTVERAVETASPQVRPSSSDLDTTMLEISVDETRLPSRNSSRPREIDAMYTLHLGRSPRQDRLRRLN